MTFRSLDVGNYMAPPKPSWCFGCCAEPELDPCPHCGHTGGWPDPETLDTALRVTIRHARRAGESNGKIARRMGLTEARVHGLQAGLTRATPRKVQALVWAQYKRHRR